MDSKRVFGAVAVIVLNGGKVLLGQRTGTNGRGTWCFPGGKIEPGELVVEAAKRETLEEAGVAALNLDFAGYVDTPYPPSQFWLTLYFRCTEFSGEPSAPEPHKIGGWAWFSKDDLPSPLFGHTQAAFDKRLVWKG